MKAWLFPNKAYPEDNNPIFVALARLLAVFWLTCTIWALWCLIELVQTARYLPAQARVSHGAIEFVVSRVSGFAFDYVVEGQPYTSSRVMIGGRNLGKVPAEGEIQIWYDPKDPGRAVVFRQLAELVYGAIIFAMGLPFLIRWIWAKYV